MSEMDAIQKELPPVTNDLGITKEAFDAATLALAEAADGQNAVDPEVEAQEAKALVKEAAPLKEVEAKVEEAAPSKSVAKGWAAVKEAEQAARREREATRKELAEVRKMREQMSISQKQTLDVIASLKADPRNLEKLGIPLNEFLERVIKDGEHTPQSAARAATDEIGGLKQQINELKSMLNGFQARTGEERYRGQCEGVLAKPEYDLLRSHPDAIGEMLKFTAEYYNTYGKMDLTPSQIAATLQDTWQEQLSSLRSAKAVRKVFGLSEEETPAQEPSAPQRTDAGRKAKPKTVTPNMASSPSRGAPPKQNRPRREEDAITEVMKLVPSDVWNNVD